MTKSAYIRWSSPELILVATNLLEGHKLTLHAIYQARRSNAKVLLVHVVPPSSWRTQSYDEMPSPLPSHLLRNVKVKLDEMAREFQRENVECESILLKGLPEEQIALLVKSRSVDRVILATRNVTGVARLAEGSVVEDLIASLQIPVCVIGRRTHPGAASDTPLGRVLLATSFCLDSLLLAGFAGALTELNHSQLALLHVLKTDGMSVRERNLARAMAQRRLCALVPNQSARRVQPAFLVREGDPATIILREAGAMSQDLVILGSSRPSKVSRLCDTSVFNRVVVDLECPVITIRPTEEAIAEYLRDLGGSPNSSPNLERQHTTALRSESQLGPS